jgi:hypothetical protein
VAGAPRKAVSEQAGRMISQLITDTVVKSRTAMIPAETEAKRAMVGSLMEEWEVEVGQFAGKLIEKMAAGDDPHPLIVEMLGRAKGPQHQADFILNLLVGIFGSISLIGAGGAIIWRNVLNDISRMNRYQPLSAADAADAVERNILTQAEGDSWAAQSGTNPAAFDLMVLLTGEPPGLVDMLRLWRRGDLDKQTLDTMIAYSRVRTEWTEYVEALAVDVLSGADIVEAYIKGLLPEPEAQQRFYEAGGRTADFSLAAAGAGDAIGDQQAASLYMHGLIDESQYASVIRYSRINPTFEPMAELLRFHWLAPYQIVQALTAGTVTPEEATTWLTEDGYPADQVHALVMGNAGAKSVKPKELTESLVLKSFEAGLISESQLEAFLADLGYTPDEIPLIIESYDAGKYVTLTNQAVGALRKAFLAGRVTAQLASTDMDGLGVDPKMRDHYLEVWSVERDAEFKALTVAQIGSLAKKGIVTYRWAVSQWVAMGYSTVDATLLSYEYGEALPGNQPVM